MPAARSETLSAHWKRLGLVEGAPECAIEAAWLFQISEHHPDRGGDTRTARAINVARDELKGAGAKANEYVAAHYDAQPWLVLGVERRASDELAQRVGRQLAGELRRTHRRLAERVEWAMANFGRVVGAPTGDGSTRIRVTPPPPRRQPARRPAPRSDPATPGTPEGLPSRIDFGSVSWRESADRSFKLTWKRFAPYDVSVAAPAPLIAQVVASKALPGRFAVTVSIDWESDVFSRGSALRGYTLDDELTIRWGSGGATAVRVRGVLLYPSSVKTSPAELDLGTAEVDERVRASMVVISTAATSIEVHPPIWLGRVNADGRPLTAALRLAANAGVRVEFRVQWAPIVERAKGSFAAGRPVRPTGRISLRWDGGVLEVPVQMTVRAPTKR